MPEALAGLTLSAVARFAQTGLQLWLLALAVIVTWRLLVEGRAFQGLLGTRPGDSMEPDRLQLLVAMVGGTVAYVAAGVEALREGATTMPDAPAELLTIMAASQAVYLGGKISRVRS